MDVNSITAYAWQANLSDNSTEVAIAVLRDGLTIREAAKKHKLTYSRVHAIIGQIESQVATSPKRIIALRIEQIMTQNKVGQRLRNQIRGALEPLGITVKPAEV